MKKVYVFLIIWGLWLCQCNPLNAVFEITVEETEASGQHSKFRNKNKNHQIEIPYEIKDLKGTKYLFFKNL